MVRFPRVGVGVFVRNNGKVLLYRRKNVHGEGTWALPGGHLEFNETPEECAIREVWEETGIRIKNVQRGPYTNDLFPEEDRHYLTLFVLSDFESGELIRKEPEKGTDWGWYAWDSLPAPLFQPLLNLHRQGFHPYRRKP